MSDPTVDHEPSRSRVRMVAWVAAAVVAGLVAIVAATSVDDPPALDPATSPIPPEPTTETTVKIPIDAALSALLVPEPDGDGFSLVRDETLDLDAASALEPDEPAERALLETRGFLGAHRRSWRSPMESGEVTAAALVYRFETPEGAGAYLVDGLITLEGFGHEIIDYDDVAGEGSRAFSQVIEDGGGAEVVHGAVLTRGPHFFLLLVTGPGSSVDRADLDVLVRAQLDHLDP